MEVECPVIMNVEFDDRKKSMRDYIDLCIRKEVIVSGHNRTFGWKEDNVISYINNVFKKIPHVGHTLSIFKNYHGSSLRGFYFDSDVSTTTMGSDLKNKDITPLEDFKGKYIMKDGRHKTQAFIWLITGKKFTFGNDISKAKRFYVKFKMETIGNEINLHLGDIDRIFLSENDKDIFIEKEVDGTEYMNILFKICDQIWFNTEDNIEEIKQQVEEYKIAHLADRIYTTLMRNKNHFKILYDHFPGISSYISFQIDDISDIHDEYTLAEIIRAIQLGAPWDDLDIFETWAEYNIGDQEFRRNSLTLQQKFKDKKLLSGAGSDANHIMYLYTMVTGERLKKADLGLSIHHIRKNPEMVSNLKYIVENFNDTAMFLQRMFDCIETLNNEMIVRQYIPYFHFVSPWLFNIKKELVHAPMGSINWSINKDLKYIIKLLYKSLFKFVGPGNKEKSHMAKHLWDQIIPGIFSILKNKETFGQIEYTIIEKLIHHKTKESFGPITAIDLTDNYKLLWPILYSRYPKRQGYIKEFGIDTDHDLSNCESETWQWNDPAKKALYDTYYKNSYVNLMPLEAGENRKDKNAKSQHQWYITEQRESLGIARHLDLDRIKNNCDPYDRLYKNKEIKDDIIKEYFYQFYFTQDDFDLKLP